MVNLDLSRTSNSEIYSDQDTLSKRMSDEGADPDLEIPRLRNRDERIAAGVCTRRGCGKPAERDADGDIISEFCAKHHAKQLEYARNWETRQRERWDSADLCTRCGSARHEQSKWCRMCLDERGLLKKADTKSDLETKRARVQARIQGWENSPTNAGRARLRGGKRGRPSVGAMDRDDLDDAEEALGMGAGQLAYAETPAVKDMPHVQREDVKNQGLAKLVSSVRSIVEVIKRHGYEVPWVIVDDEDG